MAQPTREQFDAASRKVMETAPAGLSREDFYALIDRELQQAELQPVGEDEPDTYLGGFLKGMGEGVVGGAKGFAKGLARSPIDLGQGLLQLATTNPMDTIKGMGQSIMGIPEAVRSSASDPEGWGKGVGSLTGQQLLSAGAVKGVPTAGRLTGRALSKVGDHPFPFQLSAAHQMLSGNIPSAIGLAVAPDIMKGAGNLLAKVFGDTSVGTPVHGASKAIPPAKAPTRVPSGPVGGARPAPSPQPGTGTPPPVTSMEELLSQADAPPAGPSQLPARPQQMKVGGQVISPNDPLYMKLMEAMEQGEGMRPPARPPSPMMSPSASRTQWPPEPSPVRLMSLKPEKLTPKEWAEYRRYYGADKLAELTGLSREEVLRRAPGPSHTPVEARLRELDNPEGIFKFLAR